MVQATTQINNETRPAETGVQTATKAFAAALAATPEFQAYEEASFAMRQDHMAQWAVQAFQEKQQSLQIIQQLGGAAQELQKDVDELARLQHDMLSHTTVEAHMKAQSDLVQLCRMAAKELGQEIGLDFVSACRSGCCG